MTVSCSRNAGGRQVPVLSLKMKQPLLAAMTVVDINNNDPTGRTRCDADVGVRPLGPPCPDCRFVCCSVLETMGGTRMLSGLAAPFPPARTAASRSGGLN